MRATTITDGIESLTGRLVDVYVLSKSGRQHMARGLIAGVLETDEYADPENLTVLNHHCVLLDFGQSKVVWRIPPSWISASGDGPVVWAMFPFDYCRESDRTVFTWRRAIFHLL